MIKNELLKQVAISSIEDNGVRSYYDHRTDKLMYRDSKGRLGGTREELDPALNKITRKCLNKAKGVYQSQKYSNPYKKSRKQRDFTKKRWPPTPDQPIIALLQNPGDSHLITTMEETPTPPDYYKEHYIKPHKQTFPKCFDGPSPSERHICKMEDPVAQFQTYERERRTRNKELGLGLPIDY
jgi:hypothetical protein